MTMTDRDRIDRLERTVVVLLDALDRKDTERDGNWGYPTFRAELRELRFSISDVPRRLDGDQER